MDHVIPLACGGGDAIQNLQWLPTAAWREKSKWERKIYLRPGDKASSYCKGDRLSPLLGKLTQEIHWISSKPKATSHAVRGM